MEPTQEPLALIDLYVFHTTVEEVSTTFEGKTYIKLIGLQGKFWVTAPVTLHKGDRVRLAFHKDDNDAQP